MEVQWRQEEHDLRLQEIQERMRQSKEIFKISLVTAEAERDKQIYERDLAKRKLESFGP